MANNIEATPNQNSNPGRLFIFVRLIAGININAEMATSK